MEHKCLFHKPTGRYVEEYFDDEFGGFCLVEEGASPELKPNIPYHNFSHLFLDGDLEVLDVETQDFAN